MIYTDRVMGVYACPGMWWECLHAIHSDGLIMHQLAMILV